MKPGTVRRTMIGATLGALAFALLGLYLNRAIGAPLFSNPGPVAMLTLIGATIGGLVAPLFGSTANGS